MYFCNGLGIACNFDYLKEVKRVVLFSCTQGWPTKVWYSVVMPMYSVDLQEISDLFTLGTLFMKAGVHDINVGTAVKYTMHNIAQFCSKFSGTELTYKNII